MKKILSVFLSLLLIVGTLAVAPFTTAKAATVPSNATLLNTYGKLFGYTGTCITPSQLSNSSILNFVKSQYNSITLENEMKPDAILTTGRISVSEAKNLGYYIPSGYTESTVPKLNFTNVDNVMKTCYQNGIKMRAHTLCWHSQTPDWYFRSGYSSSGSYVSQSVMNTRLEFYIKSVINHVYTSQYGSVVYAWDVVNEYMHASNSGWQTIYGSVNTTPSFVKNAFQYAYDCIDYFGLTDTVSLFYNDYNTYIDTDKTIQMINWINSSKKICSGIGMQSHLSSTYPSVSIYKTALNKFVAQGYEIQITELDAKGNSDSDQAQYYYSIMSAILSAKKAGGKITGITWWGLYDSVSWRTGQNPLLFSSLNTPKQSYTSVLQAYFDAGYTIGSTSGGTATPTPVVTPTPTSTPNPGIGSTVKLTDGWYYIKNVNAQKYLQVKDNTGAAGQNVEISTGTGAAGQKWYLTNTSDGYITLTSGLGNYMMDVANASDTDGANVQIYNGYSGNAQKFVIKSTSTSNVYTVATKASNGTKMLDAYNFGKTDGTNVCQWTYGGYANQQWVFESTSSSGGSTATPTPTPVPTATTTPTATPAPTASGSLPSGITCEYKVVSDWGSSFQGQIVLKNNSSKTYNGWTLQFDYNSTINSLWGAELSSQSGTKVIVKNPSWDATLAPGSAVTINFIATLGSDKNAPVNYSFS
ncbi:endo-1,4-beta-xylanase [Anaeromicropila populeti]|uniref:Beta-xylanase n=1 Tax=Anaeromicropila populeti TaxID=37658 RepID=A0A1I6LF24_9FIRM|nr:endo-1,4-beta-xylanase [Anaeromicropila populeti]SFS02053.1 endo-1,4-beta-xylanase [Anaeromicropila populeti]